MASKWITVELFPTEGDMPDMPYQFPSIPACYVIYLDGVVTYIGQTIHLAKRMYAYEFRYAYSNNVITPWGFTHRLIVKYRPSIRYGDWAMIELRLIKRLQPPQNCVGSTKQRGTAVK